MARSWFGLPTLSVTTANPRNITPYRDYVIKSFNENKPFDQFTVEQLAGDLIPMAARRRSAQATTAC